MALPYHEPFGAVLGLWFLLQRDIGNAFFIAIKLNAEETKMITTPSPTTTRRYPRKPERTAPVSMQKTVNAESAIDLLNYFVSEARKEIRKRETLTVKGRKSKTDFDELTFIHDNFSITINFKEGITV